MYSIINNSKKKITFKEYLTIKINENPNLYNISNKFLKYLEKKIINFVEIDKIKDETDILLEVINNYNNEEMSIEVLKNIRLITKVNFSNFNNRNILKYCIYKRWNKFCLKLLDYSEFIKNQNDDLLFLGEIAKKLNLNQVYEKILIVNNLIHPNIYFYSVKIDLLNKNFDFNNYDFNLDYNEDINSNIPYLIELYNDYHKLNLEKNINEIYDNIINNKDKYKLYFSIYNESYNIYNIEKENDIFNAYIYNGDCRCCNYGPYIKYKIEFNKEEKNIKKILINDIEVYFELYYEIYNYLLYLLKNDYNEIFNKDFEYIKFNYNIFNEKLIKKIINIE